ncbi:hypothetical protein QZH41_002319 [Actinostola sp. cb2023]|nr:hypothetical protein QZH41_002319 [Actinostola sp. cb2023]
MSIASICYWNIYKVVHGHQNALSSTLNAGAAGNNPSLTRDEIRITRSVLALVCGFVICWIPCSIVNILSVFLNLPRNVEMIFIYTAFLSSAVNPIIFNIFNKPFRRQFLGIFCRASVSVGSEQVMTSSSDPRTARKVTRS